MNFHTVNKITELSPILVVFAASGEQNRRNFDIQIAALRSSHRNVTVEYGDNFRVAMPFGRFEHALLIIDSTFDLVSILASVYTIIQSGGSIAVSAFGLTENLTKEFRLVGLIDVRIEDTVENWQTVIGNMPNFHSGISTALAFPSALPTSKVWDITSSNDDLLDDDEILTASDYLRPSNYVDSVSACGNDTEGKKRKACKNCTCGFVQLENNDNEPAVKSACGSCYLGDAFRCSSCPYLGTPPFKSGQNIKLTVVDDI